MTDQTPPEDGTPEPNQSPVIDLATAASARRHERKAKRMADMQQAFEKFLPINTESRQAKRLKARQKKKRKKKR